MLTQTIVIQSIAPLVVSITAVSVLSTLSVWHALRNNMVLLTINAMFFFIALGGTGAIALELLDLLTLPRGLIKPFYNNWLMALPMAAAALLMLFVALPPWRAPRIVRFK